MRRCRTCGDSFEAADDDQVVCSPCRRGTRPFRIKCRECGDWYDGREGVEIGLCREKCQRAHEPKRRAQAKREVRIWRTVSAAR